MMLMMVQENCTKNKDRPIFAIVLLLIHPRRLAVPVDNTQS